MKTLISCKLAYFTIRYDSHHQLAVIAPIHDYQFITMDAKNHVTRLLTRNRSIVAHFKFHIITTMKKKKVDVISVVIFPIGDVKSKCGIVCASNKFAVNVKAHCMCRRPNTCPMPMFLICCPTVSLRDALAGMTEKLKLHFRAVCWNRSRRWALINVTLNSHMHATRSHDGFAVNPDIQ